MLDFRFTVFLSFLMATHSIKSQLAYDDNGNSAFHINFGLGMGSISALQEIVTTVVTTEELHNSDC